MKQSLDVCHTELEPWTHRPDQQADTLARPGHDRPGLCQSITHAFGPCLGQAVVKAGVKARAAAITFPPPCLSSARYCSHDPNPDPDPDPNQARAAVVPPASGDAMLAARATLLSSLQAVDKVRDLRGRVWARLRLRLGLGLGLG